MYVRNFYLTHKQMLLLRVRLDVGAMAIKGYSTFPKVGSYPSAEIQSVYSIAQADWADMI